MFERLTLESVRDTIDHAIAQCAFNRRMLPMDDFVYVVGEIGKDRPVKIGHTKCFKQRMVGLQMGTPNRLEVKYAFRTDDKSRSKRIERTMKKVFADKRISGEWFDITAAMAANTIESRSGIKPEDLEKAINATRIKRGEYYRIAQEVRKKHWKEFVGIMAHDITGSKLSDYILTLPELPRKQQRR